MMTTEVESNTSAPQPGMGAPRDYTTYVYGRVRSNVRRHGRRLVAVGASIVGDLAAALTADTVGRTCVAWLFPLQPEVHPSLPAAYIIVFFIVLGLYAEWGLSPVERLRTRVLGIMTYLGINLSMMFFALSVPTVSELVLTSVLLVVFGYYTDYAVRRILVRSGFSGVPTLLVGKQGDQRLAEALVTLPEAGLRPIGFVERQANAAANDLHALSFFDRAGNGPQAVTDSEITLLVAHDRATADDVNLQGLPFAHVVLLPEIGDRQRTIGVPVHIFGNVTGFEVTQNILKPRSLLIKRIADLLLSAPLLVLAAPIILICASAIKIIDPGPGLYQQQRVGKDGRTINVLKLRTMYLNAEAHLQEHLSKDPAARVEWERYCKLSNDPRVLPFIGAFLRRTSLDELPQLWNVLAGTMSLVGPRPFPDYHMDRFDASFRAMRTSVPPGLTGFWQVSARSDGDLYTQKVQDTFYIQNWSVWLDLWILLQTPPAVIMGRGAR